MHCFVLTTIIFGYLLLLLTLDVSAGTYITPTPNITCSNKNVNCLTLTEYAQRSLETAPSSNITLIFAPGIHLLGPESDLKVINVTNLNLHVEPQNSSSLSVATIICSNSGFTLKEISKVSISGLEFNGCRENSVRSVDEFRLESSSFHTGHGIELEKIKNATIEKSSFLILTGIREIVIYRLEWAAGGLAGGAIFTKNSTVVVNECQFDGNWATFGGSIYSEDSIVEINMSNFTTNSVYKVGGAIELVSSNIEIHNCEFSDNNAEVGGAIETFNSNAEIHNSEFRKNTAYFDGGAIATHNSNVQILNSDFSKNRAVSGGAIYGTFSSNITISNTDFSNNTASDGGAIRGYIHLPDHCDSETTEESTNIEIHNSDFSVNRAVSSGGAIDTKCSNVKIHNSEFSNNTAAYGATLNLHSSSIKIHNSEFSNNRADYDGGAIQASMVTNITINNSDFCNNRANFGNGGAIKAYVNTNITINNSDFCNNTAVSGSGGAIKASNSNITMYNSEFHSNTANNGGAIRTDNDYIIMDSNTLTSNCAAMSGGAIYAVSSTLTSRSLHIISNTAKMTGIIHAIHSSLSFWGNTNISQNYKSLYALSSNITFDENTSITNNEINSLDGIQEGGALTSFQSDILFRGKVTISDNQVINGSGGAIFSTESKIYAYGDMIIAKNTALSGGGIYAYQSELNFQGKANLIGNAANENGGGIYAVGTSIKLSEGELHFTENKAERGGGASLELNAKIYINKITEEFLNSSNTIRWLRLQFTNNSADYGGALYISDNTNSGTCAANTLTVQSTSSECFFQGLALHSQSNDLLNVRNTFFIGNLATISGETIFGGLLDRCSVSPYAETNNKYQDLSPSSLNGTFYIMASTNLADIVDYYHNYDYYNATIPTLNIQTEVSSEPVRVCTCENEQPDCKRNIISSQTYQIRKGGMFNISLVAVDQVNNPVPANISAFLSSHDGGLGEGQDIQNTTSHCTQLTYNISSPHQLEQLVLYADGPCNDIGMSQTQINVEFLPCDCPVGFVESSEKSNCICVCDPDIHPEHISDCFYANESVQRSNNKWISYINISDQEGYLIHPHCPFDYCRLSSEQVWINLNVPNGADAQCAFNRSGKLCGSCKDSLSLTLGSSHCMPCSNNWLTLLIMFAIAGVVLVAFILVCNLTVAVGTINGLIFYANILTTNRATFFPLETHNFITVFIAWLNLDFGFKTCFYDGMDGYAKEWLQLVFPFYIVFMVTMVIIACEYSTRIARMFTKTHPVATLATLILLSYTKSLRVIIAALSSATLEYPDGSHEIVWLTDANIPYFKGKHIPLFLVALLILLVGIAYTLFLFFYQWLLRCSYNSALQWIRSARFYPFMDAYHAPYSKKHRYWTGSLLFVRAFIYSGVALNVSGNPSINLLLIGCTMVALCLLKLLLPARVYKSWPLDVLEISFTINLLVFSFATLYIRETGGNQATLAYTSTSVAFITFLSILLYHTYAFILPKRLRNKLDSIKPKAPTDEDNEDTHDIKPAQENQCTYSVVDAPKTINNLKHEQNPINAHGMDGERKSPTLQLQSTKIFVDPYIADIDQKGMDRATEIDDFIEATQ